MMTADERPFDYPGSSQGDVTTLTDLVIRVCDEWYDEVKQGDSQESLVRKLETVGTVEETWHNWKVLYDEVWIHPAYRGQPENDDPPGSILQYQFFHVYQLQDPVEFPRRALVMVTAGRIGNTKTFEIRHPGESEG